MTIYENDTAVVYLARFAESDGPVRAFIHSYLKHTAEALHDLIILWKGFPNLNGIGTPQQAICDQVFHSSISVSDEGYDITAYRKAAEKLPHKRILFLNTFSEIISDGYLEKYLSAFADPRVGIVGASGSFESLQTSLKQISKIIALCQWGIPYDYDIDKEWRHELRKHAPEWVERRKLFKLKSRLLKKLRGPIGYDAKLDERFEQYWRDLTAPGGPMEFFARYPEFPNIHIRSNAFMIDRELFLEITPDIKTKEEAYDFESLPSGLTGQILKRGLKPVIAGADGKIYEADQWPISNTFRLGTQANLLISDNQTRAFDNMNDLAKRRHTKMSWGI